MGKIKGKTQSGFEYEIDERAVKDARMWELIDESKNPSSISSVRVPRLLLGEEGKEKLYSFVEDEDGFVDLEKVNLITGEILEEFLLGCGHLGRRCDNIVFMGIGEGLLNCNELFPALEMLSSQSGFCFAPRRITVSTSGYIPGMQKFADLQKEYTLAVSLHAPDEETRAKIIPDPLRFPIKDILSAVDTSREKAGRMVTLEYTLLAGINDSDAQAEALGRLAFAHHAKVNLIPYNSTGNDFRRPSRERIESFEKHALATGAVVTRRMERGSGKNAACGQLRIKAESEKK